MALKDIANSITTALLEGELWHEKSAQSCFMIGFRGFGRFHDCESKGDACTRKELSKYLVDNAGIIPVQDVNMVSRAMTYTIKDETMLRTHLESWLAREEGFIETLKSSIAALSQDKEYTVYKMLCGYLAEVENEHLYVRMLADNLDYVQYSPHHVMIVSMKLHEYFEKHYDGGRIDFTIM